MAEQCCSKDIRYDSGDTTNKRKSVDSIDSTEKKMVDKIVIKPNQTTNSILFSRRKMT